MFIEAQHKFETLNAALHLDPEKGSMAGAEPQILIAVFNQTIRCLILEFCLRSLLRKCCMIIQVK